MLVHLLLPRPHHDNMWIFFIFFAKKKRLVLLMLHQEVHLSHELLQRHSWNCEYYFVKAQKSQDEA